MRKVKAIFTGLILLSVCAMAQKKKNVNTKPYPYGNPVITHMYTADAAPHVLPDGQVWMVTSVDHENGGNYETMENYHTFSSPDMKHWKDHGVVFTTKDIMPEGTDETKEKWALWAPDMVYRNGKYYLYYPVRIAIKDPKLIEENGGKPVKTWIGVAVSDAPDKPFKMIKDRIEGTTGIDPSVFVDDDGKVYLFYGPRMVGELKDNMVEFKSKPVKLDLNTDKFMEAIWMDKHNGEYQISYHTLYDRSMDNVGKPEDADRKKSELAYSYAKSPLGPYTYGGILNYELGVGVKNGPKSDKGDFPVWRLTQSNHGGIVEYHGKNYLFYHTSALSSWRQDEFKGPGTWTQRSVCIDEIKYDKDGHPLPVQQTIEGVNAVKISQPFEISLSKKAKLNVSNATLEFKDIDLGTGYYYFGLEAGGVKSPVKAEVHLDKPDGKLIGTALINGNGKAETLLRDAKGKHNIYVVFKDISSGIEVENIRVFAGAPKK